MRRLKKIGIVLAILYAILVVLAYKFQEKLIFMPSKMPMNHEYDFCQDFEELNLKAEDGGVLNAVHIKQDSARGVVLYFHGNSGNISHLTHVANLISKKGYSSIMVDYRTYGKSTGEMSEEAIKKDAQLFYNYVLTKYDEDEIILYGRSFGTGVATGLAATNSPKKMILESPFYSAVELGKHRFPIFPINWLSKYRFPSNEYVKEVKCPIYIFHGNNDFVIPIEQAKRLFDEIPGEQKKFYEVDGAGHNYLQDFKEFKVGIEEAFKN